MCSLLKYVVFLILPFFLIFSCTEERNSKLSPLLDEANKWTSQDNHYSLWFPKSWQLDPMPFWIAIDPDSRTIVNTFFESDQNLKNKKSKFEELIEIAASHAPPTVGSINWNMTEKGSGKVSGYSAGWFAIRYDDPKIGERITMAFAIETPKDIFIVSFMLVPVKSFNSLRTTFDAIVNSLVVII